MKQLYATLAAGLIAAATPAYAKKDEAKANHIIDLGTAAIVVRESPNGKAISVVDDCASGFREGYSPIHTFYVSPRGKMEVTAKYLVDGDPRPSGHCKGIAPILYKRDERRTQKNVADLVAKNSSFGKKTYPATGKKASLAARDLSGLDEQYHMKSFSERKKRSLSRRNRTLVKLMGASPTYKAFRGRR